MFILLSFKGGSLPALIARVPILSTVCFFSFQTSATKKGVYPNHPPSPTFSFGLTQILARFFSQIDVASSKVVPF